MPDMEFLKPLQGSRRAIVEDHLHNVERAQERGVQTALPAAAAVAHKERQTASRLRENVHDGAVVTISVVMQHDAARLLKHGVKLRKNPHFMGKKQEKSEEKHIFPRNYFVSLRKCYTFAPAIEPHAQLHWLKRRR